MVKQSAALCLLRLFRTDPNIIPSGEWTSRIIHLLNDQHMGVVTAVSDKCIIIVYFLDFLLFTSQLWYNYFERYLTKSFDKFQATSLIDALVKKNPDEYKGCVSLAVSRLSRVKLLGMIMGSVFRISVFLQFSTICFRFLMIC